MKRFTFLKQILQGIGNDKIGQLSAAFSYGAIFSLGPLLLVLISIVGFLYGADAAQGKLYTELANVLGSSTAKTIQNVVSRSHGSGKGSIALIVGIFGMLLGAAGITSQIQTSFNSIFGIVPDPKGGIKRTIYVKLKNVVLVVFAGLVVAVSLLASAIIIGLGSKVQQHIGTPAIVLEIANSVLSLTIFILLLYLLYRILPDVVIPRKISVAAALIVSLLFVVGKVILGIIIGRNGTASAYGAAAALVSLLLWIYYTGEILFIGAEGIKVYGNNHSLSYKPKKFNLKRTTIDIDSNDFGGQLFEAWSRGFKRKIQK